MDDEPGTVEAPPAVESPAEAAARDSWLDQTSRRHLEQARQQIAALDAVITLTAPSPFRAELTRQRDSWASLADTVRQKPLKLVRSFYRVRSGVPDVAFLLHARPDIEHVGRDGGPIEHVQHLTEDERVAAVVALLERARQRRDEALAGSGEPALALAATTKRCCWRPSHAPCATVRPFIAIPSSGPV